MTGLPWMSFIPLAGSNKNVKMQSTLENTGILDWASHPGKAVWACRWWPPAGSSLSANESYLLQLRCLATLTNHGRSLSVLTPTNAIDEYYYAKEFTRPHFPEWNMSASDKHSWFVCCAAYDRKRKYVQESYRRTPLVMPFPTADFQKVRILLSNRLTIYIVYCRLNVTDPSQKVVVNNQGDLNGKAKLHNQRFSIFIWLPTIEPRWTVFVSKQAASRL